MAALAGCVFGLVWTPIFYMQDHADEFDNAPKDLLPYLFSNYLGIFITATLEFAIYSVVKFVFISKYSIDYILQEKQTKNQPGTGPSRISVWSHFWDCTSVHVWCNTGFDCVDNIPNCIDDAWFNSSLVEHILLQRSPSNYKLKECEKLRFVGEKKLHNNGYSCLCEPDWLNIDCIVKVKR